MHARTHPRELFIHEHHAGQVPIFGNGGAEVDVSEAAAVWSRPDRPTCARLYPETLCRQETTILRLTASEEPSSTEGGHLQLTRGGEQPAAEERRENTTETKQRRRSGEDEQRGGRVEASRRQTMDLSEQASGISFC